MKFHPLALVASFCVGMVVMLIYTPKPAVVIKFPNQKSADHVYSSGGGEGCYRVKPEEVSCPKDRKNVLPQPVMDEDAQDPLWTYFA